LAVDDVEYSVVGRLQGAAAHVAGGLTSIRHCTKNIPPKVVPLLLTPAMIALKPGRPEGLAVAHQLSIGVILRDEIRCGHFHLKLENAPE
jgi:hypothetical protein